MRVSDSKTAAAQLLSSPEAFSSAGLNPLRWYQAQVAQAVADSVIHHRGQVITVMFARQMGKNETSALIEAYLLALYAGRGGSLVKAAPSFKPQIVNSILRLKDMLNRHPLTRTRWAPQFGYMVRVGNASIAFLSADRKANVVGATASLLLELDEAQDVDPEKYDRDFRPMASSTNATTVLYGTAWSQDSLLERQRNVNLQREAHAHTNGTAHAPRLHFEFDWRTLAGLNPAYKDFVEAEIARLGPEHPSVQTQYLLHTLADAGKLFSAAQLAALAGSHHREREPRPDSIYVAGIDLAGEDEVDSDAMVRRLNPRRDSTVVTIAAVTRDDLGQVVVRVVEHVWWTGRDQVWQYEHLWRLWQRWSFGRVCVDASGIGAGIAAFLAQRSPERTERFVFTVPAKSQLGYTMLALINSGRLCIYKEEGSPEGRECWAELRACRYGLRAGEQIAWSVPEAEGHDDFVISLALCARAAAELSPPPQGGLIRAPWDRETGW